MPVSPFAARSESPGKQPPSPFKGQGGPYPFASGLVSAVEAETAHTSEVAQFHDTVRNPSFTITPLVGTRCCFATIRWSICVPLLLNNTDWFGIAFCCCHLEHCTSPGQCQARRPDCSSCLLRCMHTAAPPATLGESRTAQLNCAQACLSRPSLICPCHTARIHGAHTAGLCAKGMLGASVRAQH